MDGELWPVGKITKPINMPHHRRVPCLISLSQHGDFSELHFDSVVRENLCAGRSWLGV